MSLDVVSCQTAQVSDSALESGADQIDCTSGRLNLMAASDIAAGSSIQPSQNATSGDPLLTLNKKSESLLNLAMASSYHSLSRTFDSTPSFSSADRACGVASDRTIIGYKRSTCTGNFLDDTHNKKAKLCIKQSVGIDDNSLKASLTLGSSNEIMISNSNINTVDCKSSSVAMASGPSKVFTSVSDDNACEGQNNDFALLTDFNEAVPSPSGDIRVEVTNAMASDDASATPQANRNDDTSNKQSVVGEAKARHDTFPAILHKILSNPEFHHIISWLPHGRAVSVFTYLCVPVLNGPSAHQYFSRIYLAQQSRFK
jgi:hypothetical protein